MLRQAAPGAAWNLDSGNEVSNEVSYNLQNQVRYYKVALTEDFVPTLIDTETFYPANQLMVTVVKDQQHQEGKKYSTKTFTNKSGLVLLKQSYTDTQTLSTYYVYDRYNNLTYILPPKAEADYGNITNEVLNNLCFQYQYDGLKRPVKKHIPGVAGWEKTVYDNLDRPILVQDSKLATENKWMYSKLDRFGRTVLGGLFYSTLSREALQAALDGGANALFEERQTAAAAQGGVNVNYSNQAFPTQNIETLTVNYYDNYLFEDPHLPALPTTVFEQEITANTHALPTTQWVKTLDDSSWSKTYTFYDHRAQAVEVHSMNYREGFTVSSSLLDFRGKVLQTQTVHQKETTNTPLAVSNTYGYDHSKRLLWETQKNEFGLPNALIPIIYKGETPLGKIISGFVYNGLGEVMVKYVQPQSTDFGLITEQGVWELKNTSALQKTDYKYNILGQLTDVNDVDNLRPVATAPSDLFAYRLNFENPTENLGAQAQYSGNISETLWRSATDNTKRAYGYGYDGLNRLTQARFSEPRYNLESVTYDKNGNIGFLQRKKYINDASVDFTETENLNYSYDLGNRLTAVNGSLDTAFTYDENGNMISDTGKQISSITYNHLDLPTRVTFAGGDKIEYLYDAGGMKLQKTAWFGQNQTMTHYIHGFQYINGKLDFFGHAQGYVALQYDAANPLSPPSFTNVYQFADHLGNIRLSYADLNNNNIVEWGEPTTIEVPPAVVYKDSFDGIMPIGWTGNRSTSLQISNGRLKVAALSTANPLFPVSLQTQTTVTMEVGREYEISFSLQLPENVPNSRNGVTVYQRGSAAVYQPFNGSNTYTLNFTALNNSPVFLYFAYNGAGGTWFSLDDVTVTQTTPTLIVTDTTTEILRENNFYPYGLRHRGYNTHIIALATAYNYGFGGKEYQAENGLAWLDFGSRNYDPVLGRWFNIDRQAGRYHNMSPYTAMGNNPIFYTDPNGEALFTGTALLAGAIIGAITGAAAYTVAAFQSGEWHWGKFAGAVIGGAIVGAVSNGLAAQGNAAVLGGDAIGKAVLQGALSSFTPSANIPIGNNFSIGLSPALAFGSAGVGLGGNISANAQIGDFSASYGFGATYYGKHFTGNKGWQTRNSIQAGYDSGDFGINLGTNMYNGDLTDGHSQRTGVVGIRARDFRVRYENDGGPPVDQLNLGDGGDRYRTGALELGYKDFTLGLNIFTGDPSLDPGLVTNSKGDIFLGGTRGPGLGPNGSYVGAHASKYRLGAAYLGYKGGRFGINSERHIRGPVQNGILHDAKFISNPRFQVLSNRFPSSLYQHYQSPNKFTSW